MSASVILVAAEVEVEGVVALQMIVVPVLRSIGPSTF
jgi:hypothetical protein